jgi:two-component system, OmpR family, phosphate regulon response regulator PhoB
MSAILIVGDDPSIAELLWLHAQQAGHQPAIAFTGKKAKELIDERLPEVVILDWTLRRLSTYLSCHFKQTALVLPAACAPD